MTSYNEGGFGQGMISHNGGGFGQGMISYMRAVLVKGIEMLLTE